MRIATWNVNGMRARLAFVQRWLEARAPDVVGLQELKLTDAQFPHADFEKLGYRAVTHGQKSWNGVAILSREPAEVVDRGLPGHEDAGARLLTATVAGLRFTTVYVPNGKTLEHADFPLKLGWLDALIDHLEQGGAGDVPAVVCGDLNLCPTALDTWDEEGHHGGIFHTDAERARFARLLDLGLHDLFREHAPDRQTFSWWDYRGGAFHRGHGLRIDFVLGSGAVRARLRSAEVDRDFRKKKDGLLASDHAPVIVDLD